MRKMSVKKLRKKMRMTGAEFAKLIGVHSVTVSRWENGHCEPTGLAYERIWACFDKAKGDKTCKKS
jgi:DNA-binding transcriptional regulator YiaG